MRAVPDVPPALNRTVTLPSFVLASRGSTLPILEVNVTWVPFWTGVPAGSITVAVISTDPFSGTEVPFANRVIVVSVGAGHLVARDGRDAGHQQHGQRDRLPAGAIHANRKTAGCYHN